MTTAEFSNEFDTLVNTHFLKPPFGDQAYFVDTVFDEYEKSMFLTKAQEEIVKQLYKGELHIGLGFENTEENRRYLEVLVKTTSITPQDTTKNGTVLIDNKTYICNLPNDLMFITYESVNLTSSTDKCIDGKNIIVVPTTQDELYRIQQNPFKQANKRRALRLDISSNSVELITDYHIRAYIVRYIAKPEPIILKDLPDNLSINDWSTENECKLDSILHRVILEAAVKMAVASRAPIVNAAQNAEQKQETK